MRNQLALFAVLLATFLAGRPASAACADGKEPVGGGYQQDPDDPNHEYWIQVCTDGSGMCSSDLYFHQGACADADYTCWFFKCSGSLAAGNPNQSGCDGDPRAQCY